MYQTGNLIFLTCETPLHAGEGSDIGYIDLPIQREKHTHFPKVEASGLKGAFKDEYRNKQKTIDVESLFGPDNNPDRQGAIGFSNARILLFPACSIRGVFGWLTCPTVLKTFEREIDCPALNNSKLQCLQHL